MIATQTLLLLDRATPRREWPRPLKSRHDRIQFVGPRRINPGDALLLEAIPELQDKRVLVGLNPEGLLALGLAADSEGCAITHFELDKYFMNRAERNFDFSAELNIKRELVGDILDIDEEFDVIGLPFGPGVSKQLARELIEQARAKLAPGGQLYVTNTSGKDDWIRKALKKVFSKSGTRLFDRRRKGSVWKAKRHITEAIDCPIQQQVFDVDLRGVSLSLQSRPGSFSYGRLDEGTLSLMELVVVEDGQRTLDVGCGYGALGLFAAKLNSDSHSDLVDCFKRSVDSARHNANQNQIENCECFLRTDLEELPGDYDCVLANPPYFSNLRIAESFIANAAAQLKSTGRLLLVAKAIEKHRDIIDKYFKNCEIKSRRGYGLAIAWNTNEPPELEVDLSQVHEGS